ncbi:MAG: phosphomannomutase CpsG, partial [Pirellulales bacterium]|nr:phosphomannomutase CpsG [Pirellulales bacterium]
MTSLACFKAYDLRGRIPDELNEDIAYRVGRAYAEFIECNKVVVGHDIRLSSPAICDALIEGLLDAGTNVYHIGVCGTEEIYFATAHFEMDGGIMVTASHNPKDYNGMKLVREGARPISGDTGLDEIEQKVIASDFSLAARKGTLQPLIHRDLYITRLLRSVDLDQLRELKIVVNSGNGGAGAIIDKLEPFLPCEFVKVHHEANGNFPNGVPNPLLHENRESTIEAIRTSNADLGVAWDGDFDRCFFFDASGRFIEGYYIVGLLAQSFLEH